VLAALLIERLIAAPLLVVPTTRLTIVSSPRSSVR
jgi:hypothetical protein